MNGDKTNNYINTKRYDCCHFKKENMELYKLNLPNEIVNNTINYSMDEEDECENCIHWRDNRTLTKYVLGIKRIHNRDVEDEVVTFRTANKLPPYEYVNQFLKINKKRYEMIYDILWMLCYSQKKGADVKEDIKVYIEIKKFNVQSTVRDINIIFKMMYEISKICQLNYYPELKLQS